MKHIQFLMKDKWLFLFFLIWFGGMFWIVSERFVDAETDPKAYFALFGAVIFCMFWVLKTFRWDMSSKFCFTDFLTSSLRHPKIFIKEFGDFLMPCHQHCLSVYILVQR